MRSRFFFLLIVLAALAGCLGGGGFTTVEKDGVKVSYPADLQRLDNAGKAELNRILQDLPEPLSTLAQSAVNRSMILAISRKGDRMVAVYSLGGESVTPESVSAIGKEQFQKVVEFAVQGIVQSAASMLPPTMKVDIGPVEWPDVPRGSGITAAARVRMTIDSEVKGNRVRIQEHLYFLYTPHGLYLLEVTGDDAMADRVFSSLSIKTR